jgi:hypothetical protein
MSTKDTARELVKTIFANSDRRRPKPKNDKKK